MLIYHAYLKKCSDGPFAHVSIKDINWDNLSFDYGIVIAEKYMFKGYGTKITFMILNKLKTLGFKTAHAKTKKENTESINMLRKYFGEGENKEDGYLYFTLNLANPLLHNPFVGAEERT
jgi:hypothetical protein